VRHIGAGAVAMGGIFAVVRALPAIWSALSHWAAALLGGRRGSAQVERTDRDTPLPILLFGALGLVAVVALVPVFEVGWVGAPLILVFGFLFAVVSSRVTGEVGSTSNPLSGMTIAVLMGTCGLFLAAGMSGAGYSVLALMIGAIVCIAISQAGTCSQDLKTGFLVGATPVRQQGALVIGVLASVLAIGWTAFMLNRAETREDRLAAPFAVRAELLVGKSSVPSRQEEQDAAKPGAPAPREYLFVKLEQADLPAAQQLEPGNYLVDAATGRAVYARHDGVGSKRLNAPQARLMATVIDGILTQKLPWDLILIGAAISIFIELMGFRALTFAVGVYLPLSSTMPVFLGGIARKFADRKYARTPDAEDESEGTLFSSGLIAGASILGILAAMQAFADDFDKSLGLLPTLAFLRDLPFGAAGEGVLGDAVGFLLLCGLGYVMVRMARDPNGGGTHAP